MNNKLLFAILILIFLLSINAGLNVLCQNQSSTAIGVKKGYWIEYTVSGTGNLPEGHDIVWAKMEIIEVGENKFWANVISIARNGSIYTAVRDFDFAKGDVEAWIIIPANLSPGETFYDQFSNTSITIQGEETKTIASATRTVTYANNTERYKFWDKATGMYIQTIDILPDYQISANITATNIWTPQILGMDENVFYIIIAVVITAVVTAIVTVLVIMTFKKKR